MKNEKTEIISAKYITEQTNHMEYQPGMDKDVYKRQALSHRWFAVIG